MTKVTKEKFNINIEDMMKAGVQLGHSTSRINPKMQPYLAGVRSRIHIIDLEKTKEKLEEALEFIQEIIADNKVLLFVGTKIESKSLIKSVAEDCSLPYVSERWLGGTFTNLGSILKRVDYLKDIEAKKAAGDLEKYTKKEKAGIENEIKLMEVKFGGIKEMKKIPDAIFVTDINEDELAIREAKQNNVKIIGICDTNTNPTLVDFPIPASDDAVSAIKYILEKVKEAIKSTKPKTIKIEK
ncbi:MAG: 30S ribosomal protein S2 [Candidatus Nealsonbacteria bacterium]